MSKNKEILIKDLHGKPIREGQEFKFKYLESLHNPINLKGKFCWNNDELRYEIDIIGSEEYTCLSYVNNGAMYDFELLDKGLRIEENLIYMRGKAFERSEQMKAPWTEEQIKDLNARQADPNMHPYTCDRRSLKCETKRFICKDGVLIATKDGWICPCGEYKQDYY